MSVQTLLLNARVMTMNPSHARASAVVIENGLIRSVGRDEELADAFGNARKVDLQGRLLVPGFNDCHMHLLPYGLDLSKANLSPAAGVTCVPELVLALRAWAERNPDSEWVLGSRYDQNTFPGATHPTRHDLDRAFPDRPVYISQTSKHAAACNSVALRLAGVTRDSADPDGGEIIRDATGEPTGVLLESAMDVVSHAIPKPGKALLVDAIRRANAELVKAGITSASDLNVGWRDRDTEIAAYCDAFDQGAPVRTTLFPHAPSFGAPSDVPGRMDYIRAHTSPGEEPGGRLAERQPGQDWAYRTWGFRSGVRLGPVKLFSDGALTVRTAALREPYVDGSGCGMLLRPPDELKEYVRVPHRGGWQVAIHAIGDRAVELVLDAYAAAQADTPRPGIRHRIEHAMLLDERLIRRFADERVVPVVQPEFVARLGDAYVLGLGLERASRLNPTASLQRAGIGVPFSSDCPIVPGAPLDGIRAATRRTARSGAVLGPEERISPMDALRNYTYWAAFSTFDEAETGQIKTGMRADLAVLDCAETVGEDGLGDEHLDSLSVVATMIGGECLYGSIG